MCHVTHAISIIFCQCEWDLTSFKRKLKVNGFRSNCSLLLIDFSLVIFFLFAFLSLVFDFRQRWRGLTRLTCHIRIFSIWNGWQSTHVSLYFPKDHSFAIPCRFSRFDVCSYLAYWEITDVDRRETGNIIELSSSFFSNIYIYGKSKLKNKNFLFWLKSSISVNKFDQEMIRKSINIKQKNVRSLWRSEI